MHILGLAGCVVTLDTTDCRKAIAYQLQNQGTDYVLRVRMNYKGLHNHLEDTSALEWASAPVGCPHDYVDIINKDHGRISTHRSR